MRCAVQYERSMNKIHALIMFGQRITGIRYTHTCTCYKGLWVYYIKAQYQYWSLSVKQVLGKLRLRFGIRDNLVSFHLFKQTNCVIIKFEGIEAICEKDCHCIV